MPTVRGLRFDRGYLVVQAVALGLGVALESTVFAGEALGKGQIRPIWPAPKGEVVVGAHTLVYPPGFGAMRKVQIFEAWIKDMSVEMTCPIGQARSNS